MSAQVPVAVKKLKPHVINNAIDLREFLSEANTLRRLKHRYTMLAYLYVVCPRVNTAAESEANGMSSVGLGIKGQETRILMLEITLVSKVAILRPDGLRSSVQEFISPALQAFGCQA